MPDPQDRISEITRERAEEIDGQITWFTGALEKLLDGWRGEIDELLDNLPSNYGASRLAELDYLKNRLAQQLTVLGYADLARRFINLYDDAEKSVVAQIHALGIEPNRLSPIDQDVLRTLKEIDLGRYFRASQTTIDVLSEGIVLNTIGELPRAKVIENVAKSLGEFQHLAVTYADTGLVAFDRTVHWQKLSQVVGTFQYTGPDDIKTREWCRVHIGKVFSKEEILKMDNGNLNPPWLHGGGWNCRHVWTPYLGPIHRT